MLVVILVTVAERLTFDIRAWPSFRRCSKTDLPVNYGQGINPLQANVDNDDVDGPNRLIASSM
jgi:hypothetical protein